MQQNINNQNNIKFSNNKTLWIIFTTILIDMIGVGVLLPIFPMLVLTESPFRITPDYWSLSQGFIMAGFLSASFPLAQFFASPILGQMSDKHGRRNILIISLVGTGLSYLLFAYAIYIKNIPLLFISRIIDGISGGNIAVAQAVIGDISDPKSRAKNFGLIGVAFGVGFILGPFLGGKLSDHTLLPFFNLTTPFIFASFLSLINILLIIKFLPETVKARDVKLDLSKSLKNIKKVFLYKDIKAILITIFLFNAGFTFFTTFLGIVLAHKYSFTNVHIGNYYAYMGIMIIIAQGVIVRRLSGKLNDYKVLTFSIIIVGVVISLYYFIPQNYPIWLYYLPPMLALFSALTRAFSMALLTRLSPNGKLGEIMGINSSLMALAQSLPAILAGYLATNHATLPILIGGIITILAGIWYNYHNNQY